MKERPIPFKGAMVRTILNGTKTQTRRLVNPQPPAGHTLAGWCVHSTHKADEGKATWAAGSGPLLADVRRVACPYGQPGDHLWVREAWRASLAYELTKPSEIPSGEPLGYEADGEGNLLLSNAGKLRPSMFMPRWASRITLEITSVRVERLQDISIPDAMAEGCPGGEHGDRYAAVEQYRALWESINGPESWAANPWVWVIEFKRKEQA